jgi:hypothetical protein
LLKDPGSVAAVSLVGVSSGRQILDRDTFNLACKKKVISIFYFLLLLFFLFFNKKAKKNKKQSNSDKKNTFGLVPQAVLAQVLGLEGFVLLLELCVGTMLMGLLRHGGMYSTVNGQRATEKKKKVHLPFWGPGMF